LVVIQAPESRRPLASTKLHGYVTETPELNS